MALYAFSSFLIYPLVQQYVYRRFWEQLTNTTYPGADNTSRCLENNSQSSYFEVHQTEDRSIETRRDSGSPTCAASILQQHIFANVNICARRQFNDPSFRAVM